MNDVYEIWVYLEQSIRNMHDKGNVVTTGWLSRWLKMMQLYGIIGWWEVHQTPTGIQVVFSHADDPDSVFDVEL